MSNIRNGFIKMSEKESGAKVANPVKKTESDVLWEEVKNLPINIFSLPNQKVGAYLQKFKHPGLLCVKPSGGAVLPALEEALGDKYTLEVNDMFWIIRKVSGKTDLSGFTLELEEE